MNPYTLIGTDSTDDCMRMNGGEIIFGHNSSVGFRYRRTTYVVMDEQVAQALLELSQRSRRMLTESTSEEFFHLRHSRGAVEHALTRAANVVALAATQLNQAGVQRERVIAQALSSWMVQPQGSMQHEIAWSCFKDC